ncbi:MULTISPECIES: hypothetical protein [Jannaschia]|uniref:hypothetical protein n=1 Tax=Jannaschia TaxID=188905 RepID=UPI001C7D7613|nr:MULTISPECIES: hypothetical protein [unclassified Jannaschia]
MTALRAHDVLNDGTSGQSRASHYAGRKRVMHWVDDPLAGVLGLALPPVRSTWVISA